MPVYTVEPTSIVSDYLTPTGTASEVTAVTDASDTTYVEQTHAQQPSVFGYTFAAIGSGERIVSVCPWVRAEASGANLRRCYVMGLPNYVSGVVLALYGNVTKGDFELDAHEGSVLNPSTKGEWSAALLDYASSWHDSSTSSPAKLYEHALKIYAYEAATIAAPSAPSGTVTTSQTPTCTATVSSIVESWQVPSGEPSFYCDVDVEFAIYDQADIGTATEPPSGAVPVWSDIVTSAVDTYGDGTTPTTKAVSGVPDVALPNGDYALFVRVSREHPSDVAAWSAYSHAHFTVSITLPTAPTLAAVVNDTTQGVAITVTAATTTGYTAGTYTVSVEREVATDEWVAVRGMTDVAVTEDTATLVGTDYEAERGVANTYRARVSAYHTSLALTMTGAWTEDTETGPAVSGWNLKAVEDASLNWIGAAILSDPAESSQRASAVFAPLYRPRPVVVSGVTGGFGGGFTVLANGTTEVATLEALAAYSGLLLLETAFGDARYIVPTSWSWTRQGTAASPRRTAVCEYTEVDSGLE